jgi:FkbH-like protein
MIMTTATAGILEQQRSREIKCVVWDLDETLWHGTLLEGDAVQLRDGIVELVRELDGRGILHSIASRNDPELALATLQEFGLREYFLYPQIGWNSKSVSVQKIAELINIGLDAIAFIDDQPAELSEVAMSHPSVLCLAADKVPQLQAMPELMPRFISKDSANRRLMYRSDQERQSAEENFEGPKEDFLAWLGMRLGIAQAREEDLARAADLTVRTHQLNTTGYTYSFEELRQLRSSSDYQLLVCELDDRFGSYGKIGLALIHTTPDLWTIKLLLMSCRVMNRGVGSILLNYIFGRAKCAGVRLEAELVPTGRNRMMAVTYAFSGFRECRREDHCTVYVNDLSRIQPFPRYVQVVVPAE